MRHCLASWCNIHLPFDKHGVVEQGQKPCKTRARQTPPKRPRQGVGRLVVITIFSLHSITYRQYHAMHGTVLTSGTNRHIINFISVRRRSQRALTTGCSRPDENKNIALRFHVRLHGLTSRMQTATPRQFHAGPGPGQPSFIGCRDSDQC